MTDKGYSNQGTRFLQELASKSCFIFDMAEAHAVAQKLGIPEPQLKVVLHRLVKGGWITRIRRGLYIGTGKLPGEASVHSFAIATHLVTPSAISYWSALNYHELTEQLPRNITVMTTQKAQPPSIRDKSRKEKGGHAWIIEDVRYEYIQVKPKYFFGIEHVWIDQTFRIPITDKERTLLEGFASPRIFGNLSEILGIIEENLNSIDISKLIEYALQYGSIAVVKRVGWSLEHMGVSAKKLQKLRDYPATGYQLLDPTQQKQGIYESRWMLQNNLKAKSK
ncbi:MAG: type IV toxin-antitoxin system AbiEi family antitoxin domain-containing protein [Vampirovibrionales bacterium]|nr:type IV toxin-antitoxin system AbiEi family antitoxin domain-containing protein [Vampirovibrionales bacterium]